MKTYDEVIITYKNLSDESKIRLKIRGKYEYEVIPVPVEISVTCGIAHRIKSKNMQDIVKIIKEFIIRNEINIYDVRFYWVVDENNYEQFSVDWGLYE